MWGNSEGATYCYCVGICGYEHDSSRTAVGLLWSTLAHYIPWWALQYLDFIENALYAVANSDPKVRCNGRVHSVALYDSAKPYFQIRSCHYQNELEKCCKTGVFIVRYQNGWNSNMQYVVLLFQDTLKVNSAILTWHTSTAVYSHHILLLFGSTEIPGNVQNMTYEVYYMMRPQNPSTSTLIYGTPFEPQLEGNISWSTLILIKICRSKIRCKIKTNGYLIVNYSSLDVYELQCSGFWPFVITNFNATVLTFCGWFELNGMTPHGWQFGFPKCPAIVQSNLGAVRHVFHSVRLIVVMFCNSGVQVRTATVASEHIVLYMPQSVIGIILYVIYCPWAEKQWFNWMMFL